MKLNRVDWIPSGPVKVAQLIATEAFIEGVGVRIPDFREMQNDENVEVGWSSLATLANVYMKVGQSEKAILVLKKC
ncbi:hypothetical protein OROMI_022315 [Orobanche minor]